MRSFAAKGSRRRPERLRSPAGESEENDRERDHGNDQTLLERPAPNASELSRSRNALARDPDYESALGHRL
jgi:hypothetical protein